MAAANVTVIALFAMLALLILVELVKPARPFPEVPGWRLKCIAFIPLVVTISTVVPFVLAEVAASWKLLPGERLGIAGGAVVGIVVSELIVYWAHRAHHGVPFLWRWIHQLHHSAERVDVFGAAYFHPLEILEGSVVGLFLFTTVLGLAPEAAVIATMWQAFNGVFQHGNIRTPVWLGYFIQRPEAHGVHHERGVHGFNYSNLPVWDIVFGTFRNPPAWEGEAGFYPGSSRPTVRMLLGRDVADDGPRS